MKKFLSILLSIAMVMCLFSGCGSKDEKYDFIYPFSADVNSYDPQVASTIDEFLIIENCFEGLIRMDDKGNITPGVAQSWSISDDGLTYTFKLKKGMKWDIKTKKYTSGENKGKFRDKRLQLMDKEFNPDITANDFVFALRRAADKNTNSPSFSSISCIKGAYQIHNGKAATSTLGVSAVDNYTLKIELSYKNPAFMETLTSAVAMPCNEEFFNATKGRYGLDTKYTLFNGQFYVSQILETSYLLKENDVYTGEAPTNASELTLKIIDESAPAGELVDKLESGYYDAAFISGRDSDRISEKSGIEYTPYQDTTWAFVFNTNNRFLQSKSMRKAFCQGFTRPDEYEKAYLSPASSLTPASCVVGSSSVADAIGKTIINQNNAESIKNWKKALDILGETEIKITILTPDYMQNEVKEMLQGIQGGLGAELKNSKNQTINLTLKVEAMDESEIRTAVAKSEYDIAFLPFKAHSNSVMSFLDSFCEKSITSFYNDKASDLILKAQKQTNAFEAAKYLKQAEKTIISSYSVYPMVYESSYYAMAKGVHNIQFHAGTGRVSFINATRDK